MSDTRSRVENRVGGTVDLAVGADSGTVSLTLDSAPARVFLTVETAEAAAIWPVLDGDPRANGFDFSLSGAPTTLGARLHYICDF